MMMLIETSIIINALLLVACCIGSYVMLTRELKPQHRAKLATSVVFLLFLYCILLFSIFCYGVISGQYYYLFSIVFVLLPFIFGKFVQYKTLKKYTIFQIIAIGFSLVYLVIPNYIG